MLSTGAHAAENSKPGRLWEFLRKIFLCRPVWATAICGVSQNAENIRVFAPILSYAQRAGDCDILEA